MLATPPITMSVSRKGGDDEYRAERPSAAAGVDAQRLHGERGAIVSNDWRAIMSIDSYNPELAGAEKVDRLETIKAAHRRVLAEQDLEESMDEELQDLRLEDDA